MKKDRGAELWEEASNLEDRGMIGEAIIIYKEAISLGNVNAMNNLATIYDDKIYPPQPTIALDLYKKAVELGSHIAAWNLAKHYENLGDLAQYLYWLRIAAELGDDEATEIIKNLS